MRDASLIRYDLHRAIRALQSNPLGTSLAQGRETFKLAERITKLSAQLVVADRRELKRLARVLTFKADIYGPEGRIYSCDGKWTVRDASDGKAYLFHGDKLIDPATLCDGHGRTITDESSY